MATLNESINLAKQVIDNSISAAQAKGATTSQSRLGLPEMIESIPSGGGGEKMFRFFSFDGELLFEYSYEEMQALTELPTAPNPDRLIFQEWNWTLEELKELDIPMNVGALYETVSGWTEIDVTVNAATGNTAYLLFYRDSINGTATIDWGDGVEETVTISTGGFVTHTYANGSYMIQIKNPSVNYRTQTYNTSYKMSEMTTAIRLGKNCLGGRTSGFRSSWMETISIHKDVDTHAHLGYDCWRLKYIVLPRIVNTTYAHAFYNSYSLRGISLPPTITSFSNGASGCSSLTSLTLPPLISGSLSQAFYRCGAIDNIIVPEGVTDIREAFFECRSLKNLSLPASLKINGSSTFSECYSLDIDRPLDPSLTTIGPMFRSNYRKTGSIVVPEGVTAIPQFFCMSCYNLSSITIPSTVTSIAANSMTYCYGLDEIVLKPTTPPTLANANALQGIPPQCRIKVPAESLAAYKAAPIWSTYANYMEGY